MAADSQLLELLTILKSLTSTRDCTASLSLSVFMHLRPRQQNTFRRSDLTHLPRANLLTTLPNG